jgi:predicted RNA-binding Zn ribbon-like protein
MGGSPLHFPPDWLEAKAGGSATDLDLAVLLLNSLDLLADPPDRLADLRWLRAALSDAGHAELAAQLRPRDVPGLRTLRDALRPAFEASSAADAAAALNPLLENANATFLLVADESNGRYEFALAPGRAGLAALEARLPIAVAVQVARHGAATLGVCASDPCRCAFVDRTRARTRRYCCAWCNDRAAARAYRRRRR